MAVPYLSLFLSILYPFPHSFGNGDQHWLQPCGTLTIQLIFLTVSLCAFKQPPHSSRMVSCSLQSILPCLVCAISSR
ncbi:hypothetical protein V8E52_008055 [Russula decolorans]